MGIINLLTLFVGFFTGIIPFTLLRKNSKLYRNKILLALGLITGPAWSLSIISFYELSNPSLYLISLDLIYTVSILTALVTFEFTRVFPFRDKLKFGEISLVYLPAIFFLYQVWFGNNFISGINLIGDEKIPTFGIFYILWFFWFSIIIGGRIVLLYNKLKSINEIAKKQTLYIIVALGVAGLGILPTNMILPYFGIFKFVWVGPFMGGIMVFVIAYALSTLRFLKLRNSFKKFFVIFTVFVLPAIFVSSLLYILSRGLMLSVIEFLSISTAFLTIAFFLTLFLQRRIMSRSSSLKEEVSNAIESTLHMQKIGGIAESIAVKNFSITGFSFLICNFNEIKFKYIGNSMKMDDVIPVIELFSFGSYYDDPEKLIILQELKHLQLESMEEENVWKYKRFLHLINFLEKSNITIIMPVLLSNHDTLFLCFSNKKENDLFEKEEIDEILLSKSSFKIIFERSVLYNEVENFNVLLQNKVNDQTKELQIKVKQLEEARRKERDMIDIMGHELRTPATIVKLNAELLEGFTDDILSNKEKFAKYVKRIKDAVANEIKLINTLLSSAKLEGDKIELNPEEVNIQSEIEMSIHGHEHSAKEKGIQILNNTDPNTPSIYADHARVIEVLNNLVDNAIKYTEQGSVTIESSFDENSVNINIKDTGSGMKQEDIAHLGKKFFRVGNYLDDGEGKPDVVRPGGTGLGLYVTFGLVEKMGGKIIVESKIGVGSTFAFSLPRYTGQDSGKAKSKTNNMFERLGLQK